MWLERVEISGFRGINRLSLNIGELNTTLIGENTWGKSSLIEALTIALPATQEMYSFVLRDFHVDHALSQPQTQAIEIVITFRAQDEKEPNAGRYRRLRSLWQYETGKLPCIYYRISATRSEYDITSEYTFLTSTGKPLPLFNPQIFAKELMSLHPVIRLYDARQHAAEQHELQTQVNNRSEKRIDNTCRRLMMLPGHVDKAEMRSSLNTMNALVEHYFSFSTNKHKSNGKDAHPIYSAPNQRQSIFDMLNDSQSKQTRLLFMGLLNAYLQAKGPKQLRRTARPILIIEDPEGRLHPTQLARAWSLLSMLPVQKIVTTNSGDLLALVPLYSIRRLIKQVDRTQAFAISTSALSRNELRKIGFHVRFHRSNALFARCWLLVEGETEVWLFSELARLSGYNLMAEGVQILEFAQSGLKALIKVAKAVGIDWHVVTDGDMAGKKYAATVENMLDGERKDHRLTSLPERDIEHFLYANGFEAFFKQLAKIPPDHPIPPKKVVARVLKRFAKPDLALEIVNYCELHPENVIPKKLKWTLKRVITMANANASP